MWQGDMKHETQQEYFGLVPRGVSGRCPRCLGLVVRRERRMNGNDVCENSHQFPSVDALGRDD